MKERPILFSAPMVQALLSGSKTQTRRVVKPKIAEPLDYFGSKSDDDDDDRTLDELLGQRTEEKGLRVWCADYPEEGSVVVRCPHGQPGDRLWVRETWQKAGGGTGYWYRATDDKADNGASPVGHWKPSIHMPRAASRITLEITGVRVERLQDISEADCWAEGVYAGNACRCKNPLDFVRSCGHCGLRLIDAVGLYQTLWESINGPGSWGLNPWVWVIEFKVLEAAEIGSAT